MMKKNQAIIMIIGSIRKPNFKVVTMIGKIFITRTQKTIKGIRESITLRIKMITINEISEIKIIKG